MLLFFFYVGGPRSRSSPAAVGAPDVADTAAAGRHRPAGVSANDRPAAEQGRPLKRPSKKRREADPLPDSRARASKHSKRRRRDSSSESSSSGSSSSTEAASSGTSSSSSASPAPSSRKKAAKGKKDDRDAKWALLNDIWPIENRPKKLQDKEYVNRQSWRTLHALQDRYEKEAERKGFGAAIFGKDAKLRKLSFKKKSDDGYVKLHPARWLRLPMAAPDKYWSLVPRAHDQRFRHLQLGHYGAESQINEKVILGMHDRQVITGFYL